VWQTSSYSRELALQDQDLLRYLGEVLPDWTETDIVSSPYSVSAYRVAEDSGGDAGLVLLRDKLHQRSMRLILDFVPNHTAVEFTWVRTNPEYYISIPAEVLPHMEPVNRAWGELAGIMEDEFWKKAIAEVKQNCPDFLFLAEVYGEREWHLQYLGFDFTYDKVLYDRMVGRDVPAIKQHLQADWDFARKLVRFTENHDWPRATKIFGLNNKASSLLALLTPGLRLVHQGQIEGRTQQLSVYLLRQPVEKEDREIASFYERLLAAVHNPAITHGDFRLLEIASDAVIGFERMYGVHDRVICVLNLTERDSESPFSTDAFASVQDYQEMHVVSTERHRSPQFDLWPGGITLRLRSHKGLLFFVN
jgi:glycosidase